MWLTDLWIVAFTVFVIACPHGRLTSRFDRLLVAPFIIGFVPLELLWFLFFDPGPGTPGNALLVWRNDVAAGRVDWAQRALYVGGAIALVVALSKRWLVASVPRRRSLTPFWFGAAAILLNGVQSRRSSRRGKSSPSRSRSFATWHAVSIRRS
jgi:voltage-gated potassium channel Kch